MCGRFAQYSSRDDYFDALELKADEIVYDPEPIGRFNVAPGTKVLLLNERDDALHILTRFTGATARRGGTSSR